MWRSARSERHACSGSRVRRLGPVQVVGWVLRLSVRGRGAAVRRRHGGVGRRRAALHHPRITAQCCGCRGVASCCIVVLRRSGERGVHLLGHSHLWSKVLCVALAAVRALRLLVVGLGIRVAVAHVLRLTRAHPRRSTRCASRGRVRRIETCLDEVLALRLCDERLEFGCRECIHMTSLGGDKQ